MAHGATVQMKDRNLCYDECQLKKPVWDGKEGAWFNINSCLKKGGGNNRYASLYIFVSPSIPTSLVYGAGTGVEGGHLGVSLEFLISCEFIIYPKIDGEQKQ